MNKVKWITEWEIDTPNGWSNFDGVCEKDMNEIIEIETTNNKLKCSLNHKLELKTNEFLSASSVEINSILSNGDIVININKVKEQEKLYDLLNVSKDNKYYTNNIVSHNCAFIDDAETVFVAAIPGLAKTRGQLIAISTPNGVGNWFYRVIHESPENGFHTEKIYWYEMPDRDEAWKEKELARLGPKMFGQEYNIDWLQSGSTVISVDDIIWQQKNNVCEPKEMINISDPDNAIKKLNREKEVWIWENPIPGRYYVVSCDVSRGDSSDFSAFSVWKLPTEEDISINIGPVQVAEFKGMIKTDDYGKLINVIGLTYNNAIVIVENNSLGIATLNVLVEKEYPNLYFTDKAAKQISFDEAVNLDSVASVPGFATTAKTRPLIADATEAAWRSHQYIIRSKRMLIEAQTWIWINGRAEHEQGCHDDLMMSSGIFYYLYQTSLKRQGVSHDRFIGALNLITERKEKEKYDILDKIKIVKQQQKNSWVLNYGTNNNENWNLSEMVKTKLS